MNILDSTGTRISDLSAVQPVAIPTALHSSAETESTLITHKEYMNCAVGPVMDCLSLSGPEMNILVTRTYPV
jgi:hypothetical protein